MHKKNLGFKISVRENRKGNHKMDNPLARLGTQDTGRRQTQHYSEI